MKKQFFKNIKKPYRKPLHLPDLSDLGWRAAMNEMFY